MTVEAKARGLLTHDDSDYTEWGASGSVRIDPGASDPDLALTLTPAWGSDTGGAERLWGLRDAGVLPGNDNFEPTGRLDAEAGWGFGDFGGCGLMTPFAGLALSEAGNRTWRGGVRWSLRPDVAFGVEGTLRAVANDNSGEHEIGFQFAARWLRPGRWQGRAAAERSGPYGQLHAAPRRRVPHGTVTLSKTDLVGIGGEAVRPRSEPSSCFPANHSNPPFGRTDAALEIAASLQMRGVKPVWIEKGNRASSSDIRGAVAQNERARLPGPSVSGKTYREQWRTQGGFDKEAQR